MMWARSLAVAAALLMGAPGLAAQTSGRVVWIDLCDAAHPGGRIPLPLDGDRGPAKACHAACGLLGERRQIVRR